MGRCMDQCIQNVKETQKYTLGLIGVLTISVDLTKRPTNQRWPQDGKDGSQAAECFNQRYSSPPNSIFSPTSPVVFSDNTNPVHCMRSSEHSSSPMSIFSPSSPVFCPEGTASVCSVTSLSGTSCSSLDPTVALPFQKSDNDVLNGPDDTECPSSRAMVGMDLSELNQSSEANDTGISTLAPGSPTTGSTTSPASPPPRYLSRSASTYHVIASPVGSTLSCPSFLDLCAAASNQDWERVYSLVREHRYELTQQPLDPSDGTTALIFGVLHGSLRMLQCLVEEGQVSLHF